MKEETMFRMKRSASAEVKKKFDEIYSVIPLSCSDVIEAIIYFFVDADVNNSWMYFINQLKDEGRLYLTEDERREFLLDLSEQAMTKFTYELDPASRLLMMGAGQVRDTINWNMRFPDALVSNFKLEGTYGVIDGRPRFGKTALAINLMKLMHERLDLDTITNIVIRDKPDWVHYVTKLSELVIKMDELRQWCCFLDETGTYFHRKRALSTQTIDFENLARYVGKLKGRMILITHSFELDVPTQLQIWTTERFSKIKLDQCKVILSREGGFMKLNKLVTGIPDAQLEFISEDITSLQFDISIKKLLDRIQDDTSIPEAVMEQLKKEDKESKGTLDPKQIKAMVKDKILNGLLVKEAIREVAEAIDLKTKTIQNYYYM